MADKKNTPVEDRTEVEGEVEGEVKASGEIEAAPHEKTEDEIAEEKKAAEGKAKTEADEKEAAEKETDDKLAEDGVDTEKDKDTDTDEDTDTDTDSATPEVKANPKADLFSKARWSAVALDLTKTMIRESERKDDSFFAGFGNKMRLIGLKIICFFIEKDWYNDPSLEPYKDRLQQRFGIKPTTDGSIFEFVEPAGGETTSLESFLKIQDVLKAQFDSNEPFKGTPLDKADLTYGEFAKEYQKLDEPLKSKCESLKDALFEEIPPPQDGEKLSEYLAKHGDGIIERLGLTEKVFKDKTNAELADKVGKAEDLSAAGSKFEYKKFINNRNRLTESVLAIKNDSIQMDDVLFKISAPEGAKIKSITAVQAKPEDLITLQAVIEVGGKPYTVNDFLKDAPDVDEGLEVTLDAVGPVKLKLEVPKDPATQTDAAPAVPATPDGNPLAAPAAAPVATAPATTEAAPTEPEKIKAPFKKAKGLTDLRNRNLKFDYPYMEGGARNVVKFDLSKDHLKIGDKNYEIELPSNASLTSIDIGDSSVKLTGSKFGVSKTGEMPLDKFIAATEQLRTGTGNQTFETEDQDKINFKLVA